MDGLWNANIHCDTRLAACVPAAAGAVLDVGCGDGFLAARLARRVPLVVAIDIDAPVLGRARARFPDAPVTWCHGDITTHPLEAESFDAVLSNAMLHHLPDARTGDDAGLRLHCGTALPSCASVAAEYGWFTLFPGRMSMPATGRHGLLNYSSR